MQTSERFSDRVENYIKYRPRYPHAAVQYLANIAGLNPGSAVADVGSGTGISAEPLLELGCVVYGIEPNEPMRRAAEQILAGFPSFVSVDGSAEATALPDSSVDCVVCAQAFHWFDREKARAEFRRILRPGGTVALLWNARLTGTPYLQKYDAALQRYAGDYTKVNHENIREDQIRAFLGPDMQLAVFPNEQRFTWEGVRGRLLSSSYVPQERQAGHAELFAIMSELFAEHQQGGEVSLLYDTRVFTGKL
jgi:SAM-dependent methyltransferase